MKTIFIIITLSVLATLGFAQGKIKKLDIKEEGISIQTNYHPITDKVEINGINVKITPISADDLNKQFTINSKMDGKFNYSYFEKSKDSYFLKKQKRKKEKSDLEFLVEGIEWLTDNKKINQEEADELYRLVLSDLIVDYKSELTESENITNSNPYFLGNSYLSVFKVEFTNTTNSIARVNENIIVKNGNNTLLNLSSDYIGTELEKLKTFNLNKSLTLKRYNLDYPLLLPPNSTTAKYFSVIPLNINSEKLEILIPNTTQSFSWKVVQSQDKIDKLYSFYELSLSNKYLGQEIYGSNYTLLTKNTKDIAYLGDRKVFINAEDNKGLELISLVIYNDDLFFARQSNIKGNNYIDLNKNKRQAIIIETEKLDEVKRKIK